MIRTVFGVICACLAAPAALAACPTPDDLAGGIRLAYDDDTSSVFTRNADGDIVEDAFDETGALFYRFVFHRGLFETQYVEFDESGRSRVFTSYFSYDFSFDDLFPLQEGQIVEGIQTDRTKGYGTETAGYKLSLGPMKSWTLGECAYDTIPVAVEYDFSEGLELNELLYIPELEIAIAIGVRDSEGSDVFRPISLAPVR